MSARVIQITDCHLLADPCAQLKGICTRAGIESVMQALQAELVKADRLIITGDLAHDERHETYRALRELVEDWCPRLRILPGNHDDRDAMRDVFGDRVQVMSGRSIFTEDVGGWTLIGLDTQLAGAVKGCLERRQLEWLEQVLAAARHRPAALFLHHPPIRVRSHWLDQLGLEDASELLAAVAGYANVKVLCTGHVHQELTVSIGSAVVLTTPSTGVQFQPETESLVVDGVPPGYRVLELEDDGTFRTRVVRVR